MEQKHRAETVKGDEEYAGLVKRLERSSGKTDTVSVTERSQVLTQLADILSVRRTTDRFQCYLSVNVRSAHQSGSGVLTNIGAGGGYLKTALSLEKFAEVRLEVRLTGRLPVGATLAGQVRWKGKDGLGIAFTGLGSTEQTALKKLLGELVREQPPLLP